MALGAINNTDFDEYFDQNLAFYNNFGDRLQRELPQSIYTKNYLLKVKYYANEDSSLPNWAKILLTLAALSLIGLLVLLNQYKSRIAILEKQARENAAIPKEPELSISQILTQKENEILQLISEGKSNKEIAASLFVELSTVKTHINKIYSKIGVTNRKEAQNLAKQVYQ